MIIGLTGGIGSGKSAAGNEFSKLGITVIDADLVAKEAASKNSTAYKNIVDHFGNDILDDFENIDRKKLRDIIFSKPSQKEILESFLHPVIKENITNKILSSKSDYTIIMVPLIFETNSMNQYQRILVVDCDEELQISRAIKRDNSNKEDIQKILNSQASREERLSIADEVILNNSSIEFLKQEVLKVHKIYMDLVNER
jgi:dephospho-CoA kinase